MTGWSRKAVYDGVLKGLKVSGPQLLRFTYGGRSDIMAWGISRILALFTGFLIGHLALLKTAKRMGITDNDKG